MGLEIERKFLVQGDDWKSLGTPVLFHQGYLNRNPERSVRVRIEGDMAKLNIKAQRGTLRRIEYEYAIPVKDAKFLLEHVCEQPTLSKHRTKITIGDCCWEVDDFAYMINLTLTALFPFPFSNYKEKYKDPAGLKSTQY